jgi:outer membrane protein
MASFATGVVYRNSRPRESAAVADTRGSRLLARNLRQGAIFVVTMAISNLIRIHSVTAPRVLGPATLALVAVGALAVGRWARADELMPTGAAGGKLSLARAEAIALEHQPALAEAAGQAEASDGRVEQARAGYLPQAGITGVYQRTTGNFAPRPGGLPASVAAPAWTSNTFNYFNFGASASQLLYDFGQTSGKWRAAAASRDAALENERTARVQTLLGVRRAYLQTRAQAELAIVAAQTVENQERHVAQTQGFVRAGMRPDIDLARVRTDLANTKVQLVIANNNLALARATLNQAMGLPVNTRYDLAEEDLPAVAGEDQSVDDLIEQAVRTRPELANLTEQRRAEELTVRALKGGYGPALAATAGATEAGTELNALVPNWYLGLTVSWPLLQGGLTRGQVREANGALQALSASERVLRLQVRVDVEQAQLGVLAAKSTIAAAREALVNADELLRLAERRYETGLGSAIELGDAQVAATGAAAQDVTARFNLGAARAQLLAALGVA